MADDAFQEEDRIDFTDLAEEIDPAHLRLIEQLRGSPLLVMQTPGRRHPLPFGAVTSEIDALNLLRNIRSLLESQAAGLDSALADHPALASESFQVS